MLALCPKRKKKEKTVAKRGHRQSSLEGNASGHVMMDIGSWEAVFHGTPGSNTWLGLVSDGRHLVAAAAPPPPPVANGDGVGRGKEGESCHCWPNKLKEAGCGVSSSASGSGDSAWDAAWNNSAAMVLTYNEERPVKGREQQQHQHQQQQSRHQFILPLPHQTHAFSA